MMELCESKIDTAKLWFHGSSEAKITKFDAPSCLHPFYVTTDLHYAMAFCTKKESSTGNWDISKKFTPSDQNYVYVVTLKPSCKVFDFNDKSSPEFKQLYKVIDKEIVDWVENANAKYDHNDIYEFVVGLQLDALAPVETDKTYDFYYDRHTNTRGEPIDGKPLMSEELFKKIQNFAKVNGLQNAYKDLDIHEIMAPILEGLKHLGFQGIMTSEHDYNEETFAASGIPRKVTTKHAIGIFDASGLDLLSLVPMKYKWLKKINPSYLYDYTEKLAVQKVKTFIQKYKKITKQLSESKGSIDKKGIIFVYDVPVKKFDKMLKSSEIANPHFSMMQFEKNYQLKDGNWCLLFDDGKCVAAAVVQKGFGPTTKSTYVNEVQCLVPQCGYGKKMLQMLKKHYTFIWLMANPAVEGNALLKLYRDPQFNFSEWILPAEQSIYDVDTHFFGINGRMHNKLWLNFLKSYYGKQHVDETSLITCQQDSNAKADELHESKNDYLRKYANEQNVGIIVDKFWNVIRKKVKAPQNDIDWWIKKPFADLKSFVLNFDTRNKSQRKQDNYQQSAINDGAKMLGMKDGYEIWYVPTYDAMVTLGRFYKGRSAKWCVASDDPEFWFDNHEDDEFMLLIREHPKGDEFDKVAIQMENHGRYYNEDDIVPWDLENNDETFDRGVIDDAPELIHYAWSLFKDNGEQRENYINDENEF